jgi:putative two-component system response regulator
MEQAYNSQDFRVRKILLVDDEVGICYNLQAFFEDHGYQVLVAYNGKEGLETFLAEEPDLVILDLHMPEMNGHELLLQIAETHPEIPKIVMSGVGVITEAMQSINEGGWDFIAKPILDLNVMLHKIRLVEEKAHLLLQNRLYQEHLEHLVEAKTADVQRLNLQIIATQKEIVAKLGDVIETRSKETGNHVRRVALISRLLALKYGLDPQEAEIIRMASPLHDVGKIGIPDEILNKKGKLSESEFERIKSHSNIGYEMLKGSDQPIIKAGAIIAQQHHERWDGSGYPLGLKGEEIHVYGRITCLADCYDALRQKRHYKEAWSEERTLAYLRENSGVMFEPKLVELFLKNLSAIEAIVQANQQAETEYC